MPINKLDNKLQPLITAPLVLTNTYQDLWVGVPGGPLVKPMDCTGIALWLNLDINLSTGFRVRMVATTEEGSSDFYSLPIKDVTTSAVNITPNEFLFSNNVDQKLVMTFSLSDQLPYVKFQVKVDVVGGTPAQVLSAGLTFTSASIGGD